MWLPPQSELAHARSATLRRGSVLPSKEVKAAAKAAAVSNMLAAAASKAASSSASEK